jgi:type II secretory pathway pseudopilin PulG
VAALSLIEIVLVLGVAATLGEMAIPETLSALDDLRAAGAARYVSTRLQRMRMEAITRNSAAALRFTPVAGQYSISGYVDGNRNGVLSRDILSGTDRAIQPPTQLGDQFAGVEFGAVPGLPAVDPSSVPPGTDPIRLGSSDMVSFTPAGTATPGSLYIRGQRNTQFVVRIFGETGKTRVLKFNAGSGQWMPLSGT